MSLNAPQPTPGTPEYQNWVEQQNAALAQYRREYEAAMRAQGVTVTWQNQEAVTGPYALIDPGNATLTRDGYSTEVLVSRTRAQSTDPASLAAFDQQFNLRFQAQIQPGPLPSIWFVPESNDGFQGDPTIRNSPGPQWSVPGPSTTVAVPPVSSQPAQAPPNPNAGTIVTPLNPSLISPTIPAEQQLNFDQWNFLYKEETGREGPPPEDIPGASRDRLYTRAQWWQLVAAWYAVAPPTGGGTPPATGGGGTPPATGGGGGTPPATGGSNPIDNASMTALAVIAIGVVLLARLAK